MLLSARDTTRVELLGITLRVAELLLSQSITDEQRKALTEVQRLLLEVTKADIADTPGNPLSASVAPERAMGEPPRASPMSAPPLQSSDAIRRQSNFDSSNDTTLPTRLVSVQPTTPAKEILIYIGLIVTPLAALSGVYLAWRKDRRESAAIKHAPQTGTPTESRNNSAEQSEAHTQEHQTDSGQT
jgi:hypothetical protein